MTMERVLQPFQSLDYAAETDFSSASVCGAGSCSDGVPAVFGESKCDVLPFTRPDHGGYTMILSSSSIRGEAPFGERKRRRGRTSKNEQKKENQRISHIAAERKRRRQMNEYLSILRSLMPASYVQRGDQASIIGGALNFVKELEQILHRNEALARNRSQLSYSVADPLTMSACESALPLNVCLNHSSSSSAAVGVEVTLVENHATIRIRAGRSRNQLLNMIAGLQTNRLTVLHLNLATVNETVLYSFIVKLDEDCHLNTAEDIAAVASHILRAIGGNRRGRADDERIIV